MVAKRFDVFLVSLDPTIGSEIRKTRPCVIVSPDELNIYLATVIVAPLTTAAKNYGFRVECHFQNKHGSIALDQLRTVDKRRLVKKLGELSFPTQKETLAGLAELFAE